MQKNLKKETIVLLALCFLPILALPAINSVRIGRIAQKDIKGACSPKADDCLTNLIQLTKKYPYTNRFRVEGENVVNNMPGYTETWHRGWFFDRKNKVVISYCMDSYDYSYKGEWGATKLVCHGINDALLQEFAQTSNQNDQISDLKAFCKNHRCRVVSDSDTDWNKWDQWEKLKN